MKKSLLFLPIFLPFFSQSQEKAGIANSNYLSSTSIFLNPSSSVDSRTYMQLNLAAGYVAGMNNIGYLRKFSYYDAIKKYEKNQDYVDPRVGTIVLKKFLYGYGSADGPVFVMSKRNYGLGFFVRARTVVEARGTPYRLTRLLLGQIDPSAGEDFDVDIRNARFANMTWLEAGGNFGIMARRYQNHLITIGANVKYIRGIEIVYADAYRLKANQTDSMVNVPDVQGKLRFTDNNLHGGNGAGMDIGITYKKMLGPVETYNAHSTQSNCQYVDYRYKVGVSLRDLGFIRFRHNPSLADIKGSGYFYTDRDEAYYRSNLAPDLQSNYRHNPFLASLPTNLSVQFDYNLGYNFYFNGTAVKNIVPNRFTGVQSSNIIAFCPRYETRLFEVGVPLVLHRYIYPELGLALRYRTIVLGFDNLLPAFFRKNVYGLGLYFHVGISLFRNPACKTKTLRVADCPPGMKTRERRTLKSLFRKQKRD